MQTYAKKYGWKSKPRKGYIFLCCAYPEYYGKDVEKTWFWYVVGHNIINEEYESCYGRTKTRKDARIAVKKAIDKTMCIWTRDT